MLSGRTTVRACHHLCNLVELNLEVLEHVLKLFIVLRVDVINFLELANHSITRVVHRALDFSEPRVMLNERNLDATKFLRVLRAHMVERSTSEAVHMFQDGSDYPEALLAIPYSPVAQLASSELDDDSDPCRLHSGSGHDDGSWIYLQQWDEHTVAGTLLRYHNEQSHHLELRVVLSELGAPQLEDTWVHLG